MRVVVGRPDAWIMPRYHFKLVNTHIVSDYGVHDLPDDAAAEIEALKLARSLREGRLELVGRNCSILATDYLGREICSIPIDTI